MRTHADANDHSKTLGPPQFLLMTDISHRPAQTHTVAQSPFASGLPPPPPSPSQLPSAVLSPPPSALLVRQLVSLPLLSLQLSAFPSLALLLVLWLLLLVL